ncbi:TonB-dependent receptor [Mucilaginibacter myungsuensis]
MLCGFAHAQGTHNITGSVIDSTKQTVPGASVKLKTDAGDSTVRVTGIDGKFSFANIKANKVDITITSIGYQGQIKHFTFANDNAPLEIGAVTLKNLSTLLGGVTIVGITPVTLKEDTTQYSAAAYKVRDNAPVEDLIKKLPGIDVDKDGAVTAKGKSVARIRVNGKDVFGGDLQSITKNLPADVVENIQLIDDYGDQANLTGIKSGDPTQIMNITIRKDKNYGYSANITAGGGRDALPSPLANDQRYTGQLNSFKFKGDQQIYLLGNFNNVNANTFNFGGGGGGGNFGGGGGGGRGNAARGAGGGGQNGITDVHTAGVNFRDQWGDKLSVYGSYSFQDNVSNTNSTTKQQTNIGNNYLLSDQSSREINNTLSHRFTWNMEWKPDTLNYVKFTPTFSYNKIRTNYSDMTANTSSNDGVENRLAYNSTTGSNSVAPNYGTQLMFNHRFSKPGRNFNVFTNASSNHTEQDQNPIYNYTLGNIPPGVDPNQFITVASRVNSINTSVSYAEPLSKVSFLEFSYNFNYSHTTSERVTSSYNGAADQYVFNPALSNDFRYTFMTNRLSVNYRLIEKNYNLTVGLGGQPSVLDGVSPMRNVKTSISRFNIVPSLRYQWNISKSQSLNLQYNGNANQPTFNQIQPVTDRSNALYPVEGNPNLAQEFNNNIQLRFNKFSFDSGDTFFFNFNYNQTDNKIVTNSVTFADTPGTVLTRYRNADGYYQLGGFGNYSKPFDNRKFTVQVGTGLQYTNNIGFQTSVNAAQVETSLRNVAKTLTLSPNANFRVDITDVIDTRISTSYSINKTDNSVQNRLTAASSNVREWKVGLNGKNYLWKDWTVSYDLTKTNNYGYTIPVTNPTILNTYIERRFLKNNMATIRLSGNDLFNQNTGFNLSTSATSFTETNTNRLGRHFLLTLNIRLQKFAGRAPTSGDERGGPGMPGGRGGDRGNRGGMGGPPGGGPGGF